MWYSRVQLWAMMRGQDNHEKSFGTVTCRIWLSGYANWYICNKDINHLVLRTRIEFCHPRRKWFAVVWSFLSAMTSSVAKFFRSTCLELLTDPELASMYVKKKRYCKNEDDRKLRSVVVHVYLLVVHGLQDILFGGRWGDQLSIDY